MDYEYTKMKQYDNEEDFYKNLNGKIFERLCYIIKFYPDDETISLLEQENPVWFSIQEYDKVNNVEKAIFKIDGVTVKGKKICSELNVNSCYLLVILTDNVSFFMQPPVFLDKNRTIHLEYEKDNVKNKTINDKIYVVGIFDGETDTVANVTHSKQLAIKLSNYYSNDFESSYYREIEITEDFVFDYIYTVDYYNETNTFSNVKDVTFNNSKPYEEISEYEKYLRIKINSHEKLAKEDIINIARIKVMEYMNEDL